MCIGDSHQSGVPDIARGPVGFGLARPGLSCAVRPQAQRDALHLAALFQKQKRCGRAVYAAAHSQKHFLFPRHLYVLHFFSFPAHGMISRFPALRKGRRSGQGIRRKPATERGENHTAPLPQDFSPELRSLRKPFQHSRSAVQNQTGLRVQASAFQSGRTRALLAPVKNSEGVISSAAAYGQQPQSSEQSSQLSAP